MAVFSMVLMLWTEVFLDLCLVGKILLFPIVVGASLVMLPVAIMMFFLIDIWGIVMCALSKTMTVRDYFDFCLW